MLLSTTKSIEVTPFFNARASFFATGPPIKIAAAFFPNCQNDSGRLRRFPHINLSCVEKDLYDQCAELVRIPICRGFSPEYLRLYPGQPTSAWPFLPILNGFRPPYPFFSLPIGASWIKPNLEKRAMLKGLSLSKNRGYRIIWSWFSRLSSNWYRISSRSRSVAEPVGLK